MPNTCIFIYTHCFRISACMRIKTDAQTAFKLSYVYSLMNYNLNSVEQFWLGKALRGTSPINAMCNDSLYVVLYYSFVHVIIYLLSD